jgi:hypothetical protein
MLDNQLVKERIAEAFSALGLKSEVADDIAFHLTDWRENLEDLARVYEQADVMGDDQIQSVIIDFLAHVPSHVVAAMKLAGLGPIEDVFGVGIFDKDEG